MPNGTEIGNIYFNKVGCTRALEQADKEMVEQFREVDRAWETGKSRLRSNGVKKVSMGSSNNKWSGR